LVTKNSEQAVIQGLASDKVTALTTTDNTSLKFSGQVCQNVGPSYPLFRCLVPPRGTCTTD